MSEDLVADAHRERARRFGEHQAVGLGTLAAYEAWQAEGLSPQEIAARMKQASWVGSETVGWYQLLTRAGAPVDEAGQVAAETAAARWIRLQLGAPEQATTLCDRFDAMTEQVAAGRDPRAAIADYRESIVGWRGDGAEGPFSDAAVVTFDDGTVVPDGVELAGVRETGARHSIVAPQVEAGIDAYLAARDAGEEYDAALDRVTGVPGVYDAVADFADRVELYEHDSADARTRVVAEVVAGATLGQFLTLRNAGADVDTAVATAAGGDPVALHALAGFVQRTRDGVPEDVADVEAGTAAAAAAQQGTEYRGLNGSYAGVLGFDDVPDVTKAAMAEETQRNVGWLSRHGMDTTTATRLAAVDAAERCARTLRNNERYLLHETQTVINDAADSLDDPLAEQVEPSRGIGEDQLRLDEQVAESGQAVDAAERAVHDGGISQEDSDRAERCARWNAEDEAAEQADDSSEGWEQA